MSIRDITAFAPDGYFNKKDGYFNKKDVETEYSIILSDTFTQKKNSKLAIRVPEEVAKHWLLHNKTVICNGVVYRLQIQKLGLGVCKVGLAHRTIKETLLVKSFDTRDIDDISENIS